MYLKENRYTLILSVNPSTGIVYKKQERKRISSLYTNKTNINKLK